jgi:hypothetical protein
MKDAFEPVSEASIERLLVDRGGDDAGGFARLGQAHGALDIAEGSLPADRIELTKGKGQAFYVDFFDDETIVRSGLAPADQLQIDAGHSQGTFQHHSSTDDDQIASLLRRQSGCGLDDDLGTNACGITHGDGYRLAQTCRHGVLLLECGQKCPCPPILSTRKMDFTEMSRSKSPLG